VANAVRALLTVLRLKEIRYVGQATYIRLSTDERPPRLKVMVTKRQRSDDFAHAIDLLKQYDCWTRSPSRCANSCCARTRRLPPCAPRSGGPSLTLPCA